MCRGLLVEGGWCEALMGKGAIYELMFSRWRPAPGRREAGYTILMPVPGDLPVFLKIALEVCGRQDGTHRVETLVVPDQLGRAFEGVFEKCAEGWRGGAIRLVKMKSLGRLLGRLKNPHRNYWLQLVHGVNEARSTHALLHDADLFICDPGFLKAHYEEAEGRQAVCMGVSEVWDKWYAENGFKHIVATWEMMCEVEWFRSFRPWQHRGHHGGVGGKPHTFDVTLLPQCLTSPERISRHEKEWGFVHFNYVVCTYRWFQRSRGAYEDEHFRLLLVRLLIDAYDRSGWEYEVPALKKLERGLSDEGSRVTYRGKKTAGNYPEFRNKLHDLMMSGTLDKEKVEIMSSGVMRFDRAFGWRGA